MKKVSSLICDPKKVALVDTFINSPTVTKNIVTKIKDAHSKIFEGKNPITKYVYTNNEETKAIEYLSSLGMDKYIKSIFEDQYENPCAFYIIDLPRESNETEPYPIKVNCDKMLSAQYKGDELEYVMFGTKDIIHLYCDEYYRVINVDGNKIISIDVEVAHGLGFCPAFQLSKPLNEYNKFRRHCALSDHINELDYIVFYDSTGRVFEAYGAFPIITKYEGTCDYKELLGVFDDNERYSECQRGYMLDSITYQGVYDNGKPKKCPVCAERNYLGVGSLDTVPIPDGTEGKSLLDSPSIKTIDVSGLENHQQGVIRRKKQLEEDITGKIDLPDNKSVNKTQIEASFEKNKSVLLNVKKPIEKIAIDLSSTILKLQSASFVEMEYNLGTDFYIISASNLIESYKELKKENMSESLLNFVYEEYLQAKYRNNRSKLIEAMTMFKLDPWPHLNMLDISKLVETGLLNQTDLKLKANLSNALNRFKTENDIVIFGEFLPEEKRIERIKSKLISYVS